jgi:putative two-component system response regulator
MHDVGKVGIPDRILNKPDRLTPEEFAVMKGHSALGHGILCKSEQRIIRVAARIALQHHERWDGGGYPRGLAGEEISPEGRITAIVDVFDALSSKRVYRDARPLSEVLATLRGCRGTHFDPELLDVFLAHAEDFIAITREYADTEGDSRRMGYAMA